jgi:hypothetical protein
MISVVSGTTADVTSGDPIMSNGASGRRAFSQPAQQRSSIDGNAIYQPLWSTLIYSRSQIAPESHTLDSDEEKLRIPR